MKNKNVEKNNGFDLNSVKELRDGYKKLEENERNRVDKKGKTKKTFRLQIAFKQSLFPIALSSKPVQWQTSHSQVHSMHAGSLFESGHDVKNQDVDKRNLFVPLRDTPPE